MVKAITLLKSVEQNQEEQEGEEVVVTKMTKEGEAAGTKDTSKDLELKE